MQLKTHLIKLDTVPPTVLIGKPKKKWLTEAAETVSSELFMREGSKQAPRAFISSSTSKICFLQCIRVSPKDFKCKPSSAYSHCCFNPLFYFSMTRVAILGLLCPATL